MATDTRYAKDKDILGILAFTWNLILAKIPSEVMDPVLAEITKSEMPEMSAPGFMSMSILYSNIFLIFYF